MVANPKHGDNDAVADEEDLLQHRRTIKPHEVNSEVIILCWLLLRLDVMVVFVLNVFIWSKSATVPRGGLYRTRYVHPDMY